MRLTKAEARRLSKMMWSAREGLEMLADIVENRTGQHAFATRRDLAEIDSFRAKLGWSPHGFGDEREVRE